MQITITSTTPTQSFPAGTVGGAWRIGFTGPETQSADVTGAHAIFSATTPGDYVASVQRLDNGGNPLGPQKTAPFTVTPPNVDIPVAGDVTVVVA